MLQTDTVPMGICFSAVSAPHAVQSLSVRCLKDAKIAAGRHKDLDDLEHLRLTCAKAVVVTSAAIPGRWLNRFARRIADLTKGGWRNHVPSSALS